jgi:uncharacterized protein involved in exopolysaccharide biosynthesis
MTSNLDLVRMATASADIGGSGLVGQAVLASLWRRRRLMLGIAAVALVLGILVVVAMPKRYTAEAHIRGEFLALDTAVKDDKSMGMGSISLDLGRVMETQSGLLQSQQVALRVVQQIGLERLTPVVSQPRWLPSALDGSATKTTEELEETAAARLLKSLSVRSDPSAYLLTVMYSAGDPELAVVIANTFAAELLRNARLQQLSQQRAYAEATLAQQLAKFGDKHPRVADARMKLAATNGLLKDQLSEAPEAVVQAAGENVTQATSHPSSPRTVFVIGLLLLIGLVIGICASLWLEHDRWWQAFSRY